MQPYKSELLPLWRFKTEAIAKESAAAITQKWNEYMEDDDFVGADLARKYLQMVCFRYNFWPRLSVQHTMPFEQKVCCKIMGNCQTYQMTLSSAHPAGNSEQQILHAMCSPQMSVVATNPSGIYKSSTLCTAQRRTEV